VKINKLSFPSDKVSEQENQEEEYDSQELTDKYHTLSMALEEKDTDINQSIYKIREIVHENNKKPIKGNRRLPRWTLCF
jgi:hypothetical protein